MSTWSDGSNGVRREGDKSCSALGSLETITPSILLPYQASGFVNALGNGPVGREPSSTAFTKRRLATSRRPFWVFRSQMEYHCEKSESSTQQWWCMFYSRSQKSIIININIQIPICSAHQVASVPTILF